MVATLTGKRKLKKKREKKAFDAKRARGMARPDALYMMVGGIGAIMAGGAFPMWGLLFSETIELLFRPVLRCPNVDGIVPEGFLTCETYWSSVAHDIQDHSFRVAFFWVVVMFAVLIGNVLNYWGCGMASERMSKRIRDTTFTAILRQEPAYFDKLSVGGLTTQLQDDAARIQAFTGEPVRQLLTSVASLVIGLALSFVVRIPEYISATDGQSCLFLPFHLLFIVHVAVCPVSHCLRSFHGIRNFDENEANVGRRHW